jgi:hypothetical protein
VGSDVLGHLDELIHEGAVVEVENAQGTSRSAASA